MMKIQHFLVLMLILFISSCAQDALLDPNGKTTISNFDENSNEAISLNIGMPNLSSRSLGGVGDVTGEHANQWDGQSVNLLMFQRGKLREAIDGFGKSVIPIGSKFKTPVGVNTGNVSFNDEVRYYPMFGFFDFWGYFIDDAKGLEGRVFPFFEFSKDSTTYSADLVIDGSQDLMVAKGIFSTQDKADMINVDLNASGRYVASGDKVVLASDKNTEISGNDRQRMNDLAASAFSATTARRGLKPTLQFKHLLSRLFFNVYAAEHTALESNKIGDLSNYDYYVSDSLGQYKKEASFPTEGSFAVTPATTTGVQITNVQISNAYNKFRFVAVSTNPKFFDNAQSLVDGALCEPGKYKSATLTLKQRSDADDKKLISLTPVTPKEMSPTSATRIGESILFYPTDTVRLEVTLRQLVKVKDKIVDSDGHLVQKVGYAWKSMPFSIDVAGALKSDDDTTGATEKFAPGKYYNFNLGVFSLERIDVKASLVKWEKGATVDADLE